MAALSQAELADLNASMESRTPQELLAWAKTTFGDRVAILSALQRAGCTICHLASAARVNLDVLFVDTGVLFPETLATRDKVAALYGLKIITLSPEMSMEEQTEKLGILYLTPDGQAQCCEMRVRNPEPLLKLQREVRRGSSAACAAATANGSAKVPILGC